MRTLCAHAQVGEYPVQLKAVDCVGAKATCSALVQVTAAAPTAVCAPAVSLPAGTDCMAHPSAAQLLAAVNSGSLPGTGAPLVLTLSPPLPSDIAAYSLPVGSTEVLLTASTCVGASTCTSLVTVAAAPPAALCAPTLLLPATAGCAAHPTTAELLAPINQGSTAGSGGPLALALTPAAPAGGVYTLPTGTFTISLSVKNCAGSDTCSTLVTVADQEKLLVRFSSLGWSTRGLHGRGQGHSGRLTFGDA